MTRFLLLLCAAFLLAGCGAKGVTVVDKSGFVTMSQRMPQEMKARGLLTDDGSYISLPGGAQKIFEQLIREQISLQNYPKVTVTPIFQLLFYALETLPSNWMSPFDYQSFIYFRAVSHINILFKSVTCHRFLLSPLLEPVYGVTPVTRVFCILRHLCHPHDTKKVFYIIYHRFSFYSYFS